MITAYFVRNSTLEALSVHAQNTASLKEAIWIDLFFPTKEEQALITECLQIDIPTEEDMHEIEMSSRLYDENGALFMTAIMVASSTSLMPQHEPVTFIYAQKKIITVRYIDLLAFNICLIRIKKNVSNHQDAMHIFMELLNSAVDRLADILEIIGRRLETYSQTIFNDNKTNLGTKTNINYNHLLRELGSVGSLSSQSRESLATFTRLIAFFSQRTHLSLKEKTSLDISLITEDIQSLSEHVNFLSTKINFLLDATLGLINIEQNNIIKLFSIVAVIFLPPTLIATIYGMNFKNMPELSWLWGYPAALILIVLTAWLPYKYAKLQKWL